MAKYTGMVLTAQGKDLLARAIISQEVITFTKVEIGKGDLLPEDIQEELTALKDSFKILSITSTAVLEEGSFRVRVAFNNAGVTSDTYLKEIGIFARGEDGVEKLYSYCHTDSPDLIPGEGSGVMERVEDLITYISNATTINAVIDESNIYATIQDLNEGLARCPYGIGDYWITENSENPATKWTGTTWEKLEGRMLFGADGVTYLVGAEGGVTQVTLSLDNMPPHRHVVDAHSHTQPTHTHGIETAATSSTIYKKRIYTSYPSAQGSGVISEAGGGENTGSASPYTDYRGSATPFNVLNAYRSVNIWRRAA